MSEEERQAANEEAPVESLEEAPTSEEPKVESTQPEEQTQPEKPVEADKHVPRAEKRIKKLLEDQKVLKETVAQLRNPKDPTPPRLPWEKEEPFVPQDEQGYLDPERFERNIDARVEKKLAERLEQQRRVDAFTKAITDHEVELNKVVADHPELDEKSDSYDPELAEDFLERYQDANYLPDGSFYPRKKPTEIVEKLLKLRGTAVAKETAKITGKMVQQANEQAVSPRESGTPNKSYAAEDLFAKATESGDAADWAAYLKELNK